uniref:Protein O-linked-mannose beta-1,2-N-acetylglucosaminyltransferase n=1 Tax=Timema cristinae TaxID=61476 RepID=A0A7R9C9B4_TIMCR|nr:unnamed protein product [Timema cristinae]
MVVSDKLRASRSVVVSDKLRASRSVVVSDKLRASRSVVVSDKLRASRSVVVSDKLRASRSVVVSDKLRASRSEQMWYECMTESGMESWQLGNPRTQPFGPKRVLGLYHTHTLTARPLGRRRLLAKIFQVLLVIVLLITIGINVMFILDTSRRLQEEGSHTGEGSEHVDGESRHNSLRLQESHQKSLTIEVLSSQSKVSISVDGTTILEDGEDHKGRGIHVLVLNQAGGSVMAQRTFDTYSPHEDEAMALFLNMVSDGRVIIFAIKDEGTFQMKQPARELLKRLGSKRADVIGWRDMWAMVTQKGAKMFGESYSKSTEFNSWGAPVVLRAEVPLISIEGIMLRSLLSANGANSDMITVYIDGYFEEPLEVTKLFGLRGIQHTPIGLKNARISQHYKASLTATFNIFPDAKYAIIVEEDLDVSPDFFSPMIAIKIDIILPLILYMSVCSTSYFSQTLRLLEEDPSLYCISAWNDQGYEHTSDDPSLLYRVETMPGLGWLLKRALYKDELESKWPTPEKVSDDCNLNFKETSFSVGSAKVFSKV